MKALKPAALAQVAAPDVLVNFCKVQAIPDVLSLYFTITEVKQNSKKPALRDSCWIEPSITPNGIKQFKTLVVACGQRQMQIINEQTAVDPWERQ